MRPGHGSPWSRATVAFVVVSATAWGAAPARANARLETEEQRISRILQSTLVAHGAEVHRCFEKALADTMEVSGKIELAVDVGDGGRVTKTAPALDEAQSPVLLACLQTSAETWSFAGISPGSTVIVPLDFEGQAAQFTLKAADAPDHGPGAPGAKGARVPKGKKPVATPSAPPPFSVKLLVDEQTMRARQASLSLLTVAPASRIAMHKHPVSEILYVLKGHARILSQAGTAPERLDEGTAIFIPVGAPHVIENMGRQTPAVLLDYFVPMGPERVYRDPTDPVGRNAFEVIRGTAAPGGPAPGEAAPIRWGIASASKVEPVTLAGGKARVRKLLTTENTGQAAAYLGVLEAEPGAEIPRHVHPTSAEILYVISGGGTLTVGAESLPFGPDTAIHVPENQPHAAAFTGPDKTIMLQLYAPAGPEQRFVGAPGPSPRAPGAKP
ncbi:MAG TPA: cupin domain-containing protein [Polyangia bacterium]|nr:cupin domain-containing protein [Polyangia bacterium]